MTSSLDSVWDWQAIGPADPEFQSIRLSYRASQGYNDLGVEILRMEKGMEAFLSVQAMPIKAGIEGVDVIFVIDGERIVEAHPLLEGNMRIHLKPKMADLLVSSLLDEKTVHIFVSGFAKTLDPKPFHEVWLKKQGWLDGHLKNPMGP